MNKLERAFSKMKAELQIKRTKTVQTRRRGRVIVTPTRESYTVDVKNGKFIFDLQNSNAKVSIQEADPENKHILVNVQNDNVLVTKDGVEHKNVTTDKWLCGHDERDWFVASVTGSTIWEAKQNLKPVEVRQKEVGLKTKEKQKRKNKAFLRQGEWFFVPDPLFKASEGFILKDEPMSRPGGGKPHIVEEVVRSGGHTVYFDGISVLTPKEYEKVDKVNKLRFRQRTADAAVYGRGYVKHPDHKT